MINTILQNDCLIELKKIDNKLIDLIYLDPPFFTQRIHKQWDRENTQQCTFEDLWDGIEEYKEYLRVRIKECHRILKDTGSIFLHCDRSAAHHLRIVLDEIFGPENFQSDIVWSYKRWSNGKKGLLNNHQVIYFFSKTPQFKFHTIYGDYSPTTNIDQIVQERMRDERGKTRYKTDENGNFVISNNKKGVPLSDVWEIPYLNPKAKERSGYPTQKPILLLERIISLVTNEGDLVLDPFCGSGTTLIAAKLLKRKYLGIDKSKAAVDISLKRLENPFKTESSLLVKGKEAYLNKNENMLGILKKIDAIPVQRNQGIDGFLRDHQFTKPVPVKIQRENESLNEAISKLVKASAKNGYTKKIVIERNQAKSELFEIKITDPDLLCVRDINLFVKEKSLFLAKSSDWLTRLH